MLVCGSAHLSISPAPSQNVIRFHAVPSRSTRHDGLEHTNPTRCVSHFGQEPAGGRKPTPFGILIDRSTAGCDITAGYGARQPAGKSGTRIGITTDAGVAPLPGPLVCEAVHTRERGVPVRTGRGRPMPGTPGADGLAG